MKAKCINLRGGYEHILKIGKEYEITDIQDGIFSGDYYVIGIGEDGKKFTCYFWRFNITKEFAEEYVQIHHADWRVK